ncbi:MAG: hypothetical protein JWP52_3036, partial [Rhizobacter sp.]|nr:hypothetical protein [Rhizobacter sp.]
MQGKARMAGALRAPQLRAEAST